MTRERVFALLALAVLALTLATPIPALSDFLNHLARMHLLVAESAGDPSPYYASAWGFYPNLAMDLIVPPLARFLDVETAARLFVAACQGLILSGAVAIELAVKRRFEYAGFVALLFAFAFPFAWGFLNFSFGLGLALWGIACWIFWREHLALRFVVHCLFVAALFVAHLFALGLYGFTLGVYELWRFYARRAVGEFLGALAMLAAPALVAGAILIFSGGSVGQAGNSWDFGFKPLWLLVAANGYNTALSTVIVAFLGLVALRQRRTHGLVAEQAGAWLAAGFALLYVATPQMLFDTAYVDVRVLVAAALILPGFISLRFPDRVWERRASLAALVLICANLGWVGWLWTSYRADYAAMIQSFGQIDRGAKILVARLQEESPFSGQTLEPMVHAPTLAAFYNKALVSSVMALKGKQPLMSRPGFENLNIQDAGSVTVDDLARIAARTSGLFAGWPQKFDYLYVIGPPGENPLPALVAPLRVERRFALYRIKPI
ncbi:hypothetical protein GJ654_06595 [Rhodoblastus acidophilus]|uniref:Glycosyltransferase RgtA/B/C/D-like domain-containing protein n=1 Tax=Rhodoblastus acidophilus TaxID=1074 RepID=A0A6N8DNB7_RHOAC|nr:hypothetical protein [Rhodoblastus acidophilus]MCW2274088.1 hypothetical protein [Rhodoblastus acidophilus]MTV30661.1 hypothetical protein [Rhodoblastus acidophilus]